MIEKLEVVCVYLENAMLRQLQLEKYGGGDVCVYGTADLLKYGSLVGNRICSQCYTIPSRDTKGMME